MPLNGKVSKVSTPSWLKDNSSPAPSTTPSSTSTGSKWARKTPDTPFKEEPKKEVNVKLQSREIKVPFKTERTLPTQSILKRPEVKIKQDLKEEQKTLPLLRETKTPSKSPVSSKTPSTASSKSPTPSKSTSTTPSKSPSKTPDYDSDDDEESSYETDSSEEETDSDEESNDEKPSYKPPSPGALKKHLVIKPLKKVTTTPEKSEPERSQSPDYSFKKPELKKVITKQKSDAKERSASPEPKFIKPKLRKVPSSMKVKEPPAREKLPVVELKKAPTKTEPEQRPRKMSEQFPHKPSILRAESNKKSKLKLRFNEIFL